MAVAARGDEIAWAVGFTTIRGVGEHLGHPVGRSAAVARPRPPGPLDSMLTDVTIADDGDAWTVGYRMTADGRRRPMATRRQDGRWRYLDPVPDRRTSATLTAVGSDRAGGLWAGYGGHADADRSSSTVAPTVAGGGSPRLRSRVTGPHRRGRHRCRDAGLWVTARTAGSSHPASIGRAALGLDDRARLRLGRGGPDGHLGFG